MPVPASEAQRQGSPATWQAVTHLRSGSCTHAWPRCFWGPWLALDLPKPLEILSFAHWVQNHAALTCSLYPSIINVDWIIVRVNISNRHWACLCIYCQSNILQYDLAPAFTPVQTGTAAWKFLQSGRNISSLPVVVESENDEENADGNVEYSLMPW
jgi:hypothetical protein